MRSLSVRPHEGALLDDLILPTGRLLDLLFGPGEPPPRPMIVESDTDTAYTGSVDLPGVRREDLQVTATKRQLRITGKRSNRAFDHSWQIPANADVDHIEAKLADGVLQLKIPKIQKQLDTRAITVT